MLVNRTHVDVTLTADIETSSAMVEEDSSDSMANRVACYISRQCFLNIFCNEGNSIGALNAGNHFLTKKACTLNAQLANTKKTK